MKTKFPWNKKMKQNTVSSNPLFWFVLLLMLLTLIRAFPAFAFQEKSSKNPELPIATIHEHLILTDDQMRLIRPILKEQVESRSENFERHRPQKDIDCSAMRTEVQCLPAQIAARLAGVLSDERM